MKMPNEALRNVMRGAYTCANFGTCREAELSPANGLVPRGFVGATGQLDEVEAIFILAEPGHAHRDEHYKEYATADELMQQAVLHTYQSFKNSTDQIHKNMRWVLNELWPGDFDDQLSKVWITEGRLCSIRAEIKWFNDKICAPKYLVPQLELMPNAIVVLFGGKARDRASRLTAANGRPTICCSALAAPEGNKPHARLSWLNAIKTIRELRSGATAF